MTDTAREMTALDRAILSLKDKVIRFRRKFIPYLVYYGQEVDICVTWKENRLQKTTDASHALKQLGGGHLFEIEKMMGDIGVGFDKGIGYEGRDWEWDWSLRGPISVTFRRPCKTMDKRSA